jgi:uncharacterized protein YjiS (DUF1127 family)
MTLSFADYEAEARRRRDQAIAAAVRAAGRALGRLLLRLVDAVGQWRRRRSLAAELGAMTDHELADIGLSRCQIDAVVCGGYRGEKGSVQRPLPVPASQDIRRVKVERVTRLAQAA